MSAQQSRLGDLTFNIIKSKIKTAIVLPPGKQNSDGFVSLGLRRHEIVAVFFIKK